MSQFKSSIVAVSLSRKAVLSIFSICLSSVIAAGQSAGTGGIQRDPVTGCLLYDGVPAANCPANTTGKVIDKQRSLQAGSSGSQKSASGSAYSAPGSAYNRMLQGFVQSLAPQTGPLADPSAAIQSSPQTPNPHAPGLIDGDTFAKAGKDLISQNMEDLLDGRSCAEAVAYVESPSGLIAAFDKVLTQYRIRKDGLVSIQGIKKDLLDDTWWARSSGPDVAREIKFICDGLGDVFGMISPQGKVVSTLREVTDITEDQEFAYDIAGETREAVDSIKAQYDRRGDVNRQVQKEAADLVMKLGKAYITKKGYGRVLPFISYGEHLQERAETEEAGIKFKSEVQGQLRKLDVQITELQNQINDARQAIEAMNELPDAVIGVCVQKPLPVLINSRP